MPSALSIVTLLTDFGSRDYFVASMKGVILNINPQTHVVDLSHDVTPHDIAQAAYLLKSCYRFFPDGTVHVAVVDPGVGSNRRPILVSTSRYFFIGPDNGVFSYIFEEESQVEIRQIENRQYRLDSDGSTFDGRDVFAPAAAWLTKGRPLGSFGRLVSNCERLSVRKPGWDHHLIAGEVVYVDHFGNLISNLTRLQLSELRSHTKRPEPSIRIGGITIDGLSRSYSDGTPGRPHALLNSNGQLEIFVKEGRAADLLGVTRGERIELA